MATSNINIKCSICNKEIATSMCRGCSKDFCLEHLVEHHQNLQTKFKDIQNNFNEFRQTIIEQKNQPEKRLAIEKINQWERNSIEKIKQTAKECREILINYTNTILDEIKLKLDDPNEQPITTQGKNDFNEIHLNKFQERLEKLKEKLFDQSKNILIKQPAILFINQIYIKFEQQLIIPNINIHSIWKQDGTIKAGGHGQSNGLNQLCNPFGMYIDDDQTIYVADYANHRIVEWKRDATNGQIVAGGNGPGNRNDQLNYPTKVIVDKENDSLIICDQHNRRVVRWPRRNGRSGEILISNIAGWDLIMDNDGYLYVCDYKKHEVRRWKMGGTKETIVAGGSGKGNRLDQLDGPVYIFIDEDHSVYVSDMNNHRVMKWLKDAKEGIVVAGDQGQGNGLRQLAYPRGIIVDQLGSVYVADAGNHRVIRWLKGAQEGTIVVGGNGRGEQPNQFNCPIDLSFDRKKNLYVVDYKNNRVQKFDVNSN